jgi:hypothetical protein
LTDSANESEAPPVVHEVLRSSSSKIQPKLKVSQPNDKYEQEADRIADQIMQRPDLDLQRQVDEEDEKELLQTKPLVQQRITRGAGTQAEVPPLVLEVLRSPGQPLDSSTRQFMEPRFGRNFSHVRVHVSTQSVESARAVNAQAYTVGRHVVFGAGQYAPGTTAGQKLLSHELTHIIQQEHSTVDTVDHLGHSTVMRASESNRGGLIEQPAPSEGGKSYPGAIGEKQFTELEKLWINDVISDPLINLIFDSYEDLPKAILHRVEETENSKDEETSPKGATQKLTPDIALFDQIYEPEIMDSQSTNGTSFNEADEEAFKGTLLHEIFHYLENNAKAVVSKMPLPKNLIEALLYPTKIKFQEYAFGWFIHPKSYAYLHFDVPGVGGFAPELTVFGYPELEKVHREKKYEKSPMPKSGDLISPEEDLAESFSMYLTSKRTREELQTKYPKRYQLLTMYFKRLDDLRNERTKTKKP